VSTHTALAILTYVDAARPASIGRRLRDAIASLERTSYRDPVLVVDDGSSCAEHLRYLDSLARDGRYEVIRRRANGGISRAKNTCLRAIAERDVEIGFLAEDDILFREGWDQAYAQAMSQSGVQHFSWYLPDAGNRVVACNGSLVTATSGLLGLLLTCTRDVLARVGGFKILPRRYGYEHIQWTYRNILAGFAPFPADIADSSRFIERNSHPSSVDHAEMQAGITDNWQPGFVIERLLEPLEE
jgi:glycosyltransferase involved in cell wall biosynthesis